MFPKPKPKKTYLDRAAESQNALLNRRVSTNPKQILTILGYEKACSTLATDVSVYRLTGSSINRNLTKKRNDERTRFLHESEESYKKQIARGIRDLPYSNWNQDVKRLRECIEDKKRAGRWPAKSYDRGANGIHVFSPRSKSKVRDKASAFFRSLGDNGCFATFTFIEQIKEIAATTILNKFLTVLSQREGKRIPYLWVKEFQQNGNAHFHMIFSRRIKIREYNALWVKQQYNSGLRFKDVTAEEIDLRYEAGTIHEILNPLDVRKIKSVYGLSYYLTKYIVKNKSVQFAGLPWHCSRSVSRMFTKTLVSRSCLNELQSEKNVRVDLKGNLIQPSPVMQGKFWNVLFVNNKSYFVQYLSELEQVNKWILSGFWPEFDPEDERTIIKRYCN